MEFQAEAIAAHQRAQRNLISVCVGKEKLGGTVHSYDVHPDGKQFIVLRSRRDRSTPMEVVVNWFEELERLVP